MDGKRIGYVRVSSVDQNPDRQLGVQVDKVFVDKASGRDTNRPQLNLMLDFVREGDTVVVHSMDRLARNLNDLRNLVHEMTSRGIRVEFVKEHLIFTGDDSPMSNLMLSVMGAVAEFERSLIRERQREGIELAKKRGVYRGRKRSLSPVQEKELRERAQRGEQKAKLAREYGISRQTVYTIAGERGRQMSSLSQINDQYERIMQQSDGQERDRMLAQLMTEMEREYRIPALHNAEWEQKNRAVIAMYRKISMSRTTV